MPQKTLVDLAEILSARKRAWNVNTTLKIVIGNAVTITGKIEYLS